MIARLLSKLERGILGENLLYITIIFTIGSFGYNEFIVRSIKENQPINVGRLIIISTFTSIVLLLGASIIGLISISIMATLSLCTLAFFYYYSTLIYQIYWAKGYDLFSYLMRILSAMLLPILVLIFYYINTLNETSILIGIYLSFLLQSVIYFYKNKKESIKIFLPLTFSNDAKKILINSAATIIISFTFSADKLLISSLISSEDFATYLIAISIFSPLVELLASASTVLLARLDKSQNIFRNVLFLFASYLLIFVIAGEYLVDVIPLVFGHKYHDATEIANLFYPYFFLLVCFRILDYLLRVYKLNQSFISSSLLFVILSISFIGEKLLAFTLSFQNLSILLTISILIVVVYQLFMYARHGRAKA